MFGKILFANTKHDSKKYRKKEREQEEEIETNKKHIGFMAVHSQFESYIHFAV